MKQIGFLYIFTFALLSFSCVDTQNSAQNKDNKQIKLNHKVKNKMNNQKSNNQEIAIFGAGCFWCVEAVFQDLKGVYKVESGYSGGTLKNPTYAEVCTGTTGHAEVTRIEFNPDEISFEFLLSVFFKTHDPTSLNKQGADQGTQYRSVIFYTSPKQKEIAERIIKQLNEEKAYPDPIVTEVSKFDKFYKAEDYHQDYFNNNPNQGYCRYVIQPKVEKFRKVFKDYLK
ncbi:MAG: peptide-methionine (S)-S-oxide reductase MsrA [Bacteroidales bacterium]|nr:peptide-methionine (S)-S-oxide reductase MsrA [Bacteroidales bacterium]